MTHYRFSFPTAIYFGEGTRKELGSLIKQSSLSRPLIVTDRGIARLSFHDELVNDLKSSGITTASFSEIWGNPTKSQVSAGVSAYKDFKADCIIGLGGGAALDVAKAIALMIHHPGDLFDYEDDLPGARPIDQDIPPIFALPTTAGTGSEVGRSAVISDDKSHIKKIIFSPRLLAKAVIADPSLTTGLPADITAATGFDALTHCVEAFLAKGYHPICDGIALEGLHLAGKFLVEATHKPLNIEARGAMLMSSMMGAIAFQKGLGITHSCAHALGTVCDMHHGLANAIMIDHALKHNMRVAKDRFSRMAQTVGLKDETASTFLAWLGELKKTLNIPAGLRAAHIDKKNIEALVDVASHDVCHQNNPEPCNKDDFNRVFTEAFA